VIGDWSLSVTGTIARVESQDIDKSGRNPKLSLDYYVRPDVPDAVVHPPGTTLAPEIQFRVAERDLRAMSKATFEVGDRVTMTGRSNGPRPALFRLSAVEKLAPR
jgi:hypothetical protein